MPFTFAHPALVLPLMRRPLNSLALVCGAVAPDLPYYIRATSLPVTAESWYEPFTNATTSHSLSAVPLVTLPLAAVLYLMLFTTKQPMQWLTHSDWKGGLIASIRPVSTSTNRETRRNITRWAWVPIALLIGIVSHLLWDSLTSSDGLLARYFDVLNDTIVADVSWVDLMAHISSIVGLSVVVFALWRHRNNMVSSDLAIRRRTVWSLGGVTMFGLVPGVAIALITVDLVGATSTWSLLEHYITTTVVIAGAVITVAVGLATTCWWIIRWVNNTARDNAPERAAVDM